MRAPILLIASIALTATISFAQNPSNTTTDTQVGELVGATTESTSSASSTYAQELYSSGETTHNLGRVMSWGGLILSVAGSNKDNPTLASIGLLSLLIGIPVNGSGASDMVDAANVLNPAAGVEMNGWGTYTASWALEGAGIALVVGAIANGNVNLVVPAVVCLAGGGLLQYVSWFQFSSSAARAAIAKNTVAYSVDVMPTVYASKKSGVMPGAQIALRF